MSAALAASLQIGLVVVLLAIAYVPLGDYMARVYGGHRSSAAEKLFYRLCRVDPARDQTWVGYALSVIAFSGVSILFVYLLQRFQHLLPWADGKAAIEPGMAFNTAISFVANTNWQSYSPELLMSNLVQMIALAVQNFVSAAVGMAVAIALVRAIANRDGDGRIGNFWVDLVRGTVRILLPIAFVIAVILILFGAVQSWRTGFDFTTINGDESRSMVGPFASQEAIKLLGTNGGGTLSANSAHPFSNPTPLSNVLSVFAMLVIPVALTRTYGTMVGDRRQGPTLVAVMAALWAAMLAIVTYFEVRADGVAAQAAGAMMEGKEQRFGIPGSVLFGVTSTGTSTGAVNSAHDSYSAASGGAYLWNMLLGEIAPGGVGSGLYGILVTAIVAVFVGGLLVGRSPEFLGKKIGQHEITLAALYILVMPALVLTGTAITVVLGSTLDAQGNIGDPGTPGSIHGFSEVLYAFASAANNNGSAFGGLTVTSDWFQFSLGMAMLLGRLLPIVVVLALAGLLAGRRPRAADAQTAGTTVVENAGVAATDADASGGAVMVASRITAESTVSSALPTHGLLFGGLLFGTIVLVAGLTFFPAMALGPIAEALV